MKIIDWIRKLRITGKSRALSEEQVIELRTEFRTRYEHFTKLLTANSRALQAMTQIEEALMGDEPFGMGFVRSRCNAAAENVLQMIRNMDHIAPGKYSSLFERFEEINNGIRPFMQRERASGDFPLVIPLGELDASMSEQTGSKMANLGELGSSLGISIPDGFSITAEAYYTFMEYNNLQEQIDELIQPVDLDDIEQIYTLSQGIRQFIVGSPLPGRLETAIRDQYAELERKHGQDVAVAMRSSAQGEDTADMSFAGQYLTVFNVSGENLIPAYKEVLASKYQIQAMMYRLNRGIRDDDVAMCVGCMPMVEAVSGGVAYSGNPLDRRDRNIMIHSVWGHPKPVVDGTVATDVFMISRDKPIRILDRQIPHKEQEFTYCEDEGICTMSISGEKGRTASLSDEAALALARNVVEIEKHYGKPQDVEWVIDPEGKTFFLQTRPLRQQDTETREADVQPDEFADRIIVSGGQTASPGSGSGAVFTARRENDALDFPAGGVLVIGQALPYWALLMNRASALIAEQGSIVGHLANVAREFQTPALFGVRYALDKLNPGQAVTVDADAGLVYEGRLDSVLETKKTRKSFLAGSPVYESLKGAAAMITPLKMLDPESADFRARNCSTFHDITRFCHEKAVHEMFLFGKQHSFPEKAARRLYTDRPTQFWIIDLDDGFEKPPDDDVLVRLENIVSVPMRAIWAGMMAIPWEGPPAVDAGGFFSVLMGSATDPALNPSMPSAYASRNYFMISRNFCTLQSRFGYHFSTIESLVGDVTQENYISFQFKGGAASLDRRTARAGLVASVLEDLDFRVKLRQDSVRARIGDYNREFMESRLKILGYLTIHTRQLDMVLGDGASVSRHRQKFLEDLARLDECIAEKECRYDPPGD